VSVEFRQSPEHRYPAAAEDCYAGLVWTTAHATELRIDGGLAVATALMARDRVDRG
jgi:acetyl esterase/lipase